MSIKKRAKDQLNWLEKVLHKIPGFKGYYEREMRRDSDKLQRDFVIIKLEKVRNELKEQIDGITREGDLKLLNGYDTLLKYFDKVINTIRYADRGYTGFFDLIKIKEAELDKVYEIDLELAEEVLNLTENVSPAPEKDGRDKIREHLKSIEDIFEKRNNLLKGFEG
ncbi:MAG: hypothetical protein ABFR75_07745 [Acidobacteriota bacterium]